MVDNVYSNVLAAALCQSCQCKPVWQNNQTVVVVGMHKDQLKLQKQNKDLVVLFLQEPNFAKLMPRPLPMAHHQALSMTHTFHNSGI